MLDKMVKAFKEGWEEAKKELEEKQRQKAMQAAKDPEELAREEEERRRKEEEERRRKEEEKRRKEEEKRRQEEERRRLILEALRNNKEDLIVNFVKTDYEKVITEGKMPWIKILGAESWSDYMEDIMFILQAHSLYHIEKELRQLNAKFDRLIELLEQKI